MVGMSTVHEVNILIRNRWVYCRQALVQTHGFEIDFICPQVITARHCDIKAFAFSIITNKCITDYDNQEEPGHEEVVEVGKKRQYILAELVRRLINHIDAEQNQPNTNTHTHAVCVTHMYKI